MFSKEYWDNRVSKYGHTGHSDPFLYCFDQEARKFAISELIRNIKFDKKEKALDFGCGSGEFIQLLEEFRSVTGYDISEKVLEKARKNIIRKQLSFTHKPGEIGKDSPCDLILTVTVLQGLGEDELAQNLGFLAELLSDSGYMICMEFFSTEELNSRFNEKRTTINTWEKVLKASQLEIISAYPFYNPVLAPTLSWKKYNSGILLKLLKLFKNTTLVKKNFSARAKAIIYKERDVLAGENSTFKIYIIQKLSMQIKLHKPLIFLDIEATGLSIGSDRIVEICLLKLNPDNSTETKTERINPGIPIPEVVSKIHGIYDKDIADALTFKEAAPALLKFIGNADFAGYNSNKYDIPLLAEEFLRAEVDFDLEGRKLVDVQNIFHFMEPRNLSAAYKFYCNKPLENAHSAEADVIATYEIFKAQLEKYEGMELKDEKGNLYQPVVNDVSKLSDFSMRAKNVDLAGRIVYNEKGQEVFSFGKHKDKPVVEVFTKEPSYYSWMMNGDFPLYTKKVITKIRLGMKLL